jgi:hypothetical protein
MAKRKAVVLQSVTNQAPSIFGSGGVNVEHVLFIDVTAEVPKAKIQELEKAGFIVIPVIGDPSRCVFQVVRYK